MPGLRELVQVPPGRLAAEGNASAESMLVEIDERLKP
jgi:hypothetical protein